MKKVNISKRLVWILSRLIKTIFIVTKIITAQCLIGLLIRSVLKEQQEAIRSPFVGCLDVVGSLFMSLVSLGCVNVALILWA